MDNKIHKNRKIGEFEGADAPSVLVGSCVCSKGIFCKYHYSQVYYQIHRKNILQKQKDKYREKKKQSRNMKVEWGNFLVTFD